ncbi:hypothetical protein EVG20_g2972 [Dentipellis fragilis]|uniref:F-box domain-containing protein n=1 Tax=Dentipellis fragilis TaxID=205917 RepID=A0A4Y9Z4U3_9AGAM|nr:hypothetical protein EVG20_g2972 [Dentipellis fragilis]
MERLNDDVLLLIVHVLARQDRQSIENLSLASKRMRSACLPTLFERARINCRMLKQSDPPRASWPYIRTMDITGNFASYRHFDEGNLRHILPQLAALRVVRFVGFASGVTWKYLQFVLAAPNVRVLEIVEAFRASRPIFTFPDDAPLAVFPLTEFIYTVNDQFTGQYYTPGPADQWCYLNALILSLHQTLEVLHVPSAMAPLREMAAVDWPHLRELKLYGDNYNGEDAISLSRLCAQISRLRVLDLHLRYKDKSSSAQTLIWPSSMSSNAPFGDLETVYLPHPDPRDTFYAHLPLTLRSLQLVDRPRCYSFKAGWPDIIKEYTEPKLNTATDLLGLLGQMLGTFASLVVLEVVFRADSQEHALLHHIVNGFPNLCSIQLHRYRAEGESESDIEFAVNFLAQELSALRSLNHVRVYLNLPDDDGPPIHRYEQDPEQKTHRFLDLIETYATIVAKSCAALERIDILSPRMFRESVWMRWDVSRDSEGRPLLKCQWYRCMTNDQYIDEL